MGNTNKFSSIGKQLNQVGGLVKKAAPIAGAAVATVVGAIDLVTKTKECKDTFSSSDNKTIIPPLYEKGFPIDLEQATDLLQKRGLTVVPVPIRVHKASSKYRDCFAQQVIDSSPKHKKSVQAGSVVYVKYVPENVIEESRRQHDNFQRTKTEQQERKIVANRKRKEQIKNTVSVVVQKTKSSVGNIRDGRIQEKESPDKPE